MRPYRALTLLDGVPAYRGVQNFSQERLTLLPRQSNDGHGLAAGRRAIAAAVELLKRLPEWTR
jgi:hypothetical protein